MKMIAFALVMTIVFLAEASPKRFESRRGADDYGFTSGMKVWREIRAIESSLPENSTSREAEETMGEGEQRTTNEQSSNLFEGDIVLTADTDTMTRNARIEKNIWPYRTVPYSFDSKISARGRKRITYAVNLLMRQVNARGKCLTIRPKNRYDRNYVHIIADPGLCYSAVGCSKGKQVMSLPPGCDGVGVAQHEFLHALGFWHEQSRDDRDKYVTILWDNIKPRFKHNFRSYRPTLNQGFGYDYGSLMHYGAYDFSRNNKPTIVTKGGQEIGQRKGVSWQDVMEIRKLYGC